MSHKEIQVSDDVIQRAQKLKFISHGDGGPTLLLSNANRQKWFGVCNEAGEPVYGEEATHYDLACDSADVMPFEGEDAFCLQEEGATAFVATPDGFLLCRWVGADSSAAVLAAAEACAYVPQVRDGAPMRFTSVGGGYTLMHATEDGRKLDQAQWEHDELAIPAGSYTVLRLDSDGRAEWRGTLVFPDGRREEAMVQASRFVRA